MSWPNFMEQGNTRMETDTVTRIIGENGLTSNKIVSSLRPVKKSLDLHWRDLARELGTDGALVNKLNRDCLLGLRGELDIVQELIDNWKMRNSNQATLGILITHFDAAELSDAAEILVTLQNGLLR